MKLQWAELPNAMVPYTVFGICRAQMLHKSDFGPAGCKNHMHKRAAFLFDHRYSKKCSAVWNPQLLQSSGSHTPLPLSIPSPLTGTTSSAWISRSRSHSASKGWASAVGGGEVEVDEVVVIFPALAIMTDVYLQLRHNKQTTILQPHPSQPALG